MLVPFRRKHLPHGERNSVAELREWFTSEVGINTLRSSAAVVDGILPDLFGYHLALYGDYVNKKLVETSRISHRIVIATELAQKTDATLVCDQAALPVFENTIDVLVLPHTLEFSDEPHHVLREAERVLIGEGHILIITFNPWSLFGLWCALLRWRDEVPWRGKFISQNRVKDWLKLLGFDIESATKVGYRPPLQRPSINRKLLFLENLGAFCWPFFGNVSVIVAKKRVTAITPLKASWETRRRMVAGGVVEPTTRNQRNLNDRLERGFTTENDRDLY